MQSASPHHDDTADRAARLALMGFLVVGAFIGYEWFMSGLTKIVRGGFPSGLAAELRDKSEGTVGWYKSFLDGTVIPNGRLFGVLIEIGELAIGVVFIAAAVLLLWRWRRLSPRVHIGVLVAVAAASLGAIFMNINFHLANASSHPWLIPGDGFDEGVDMDSLLPLIELAFLVVAVRVALLIRRQERPQAELPSTPSPTGTAALTG